MKKIIANMVVFLSLIMMVGVTHAAGVVSEINSCSILDVQGETYLLTEDIEDSYPFAHGGKGCFVVTKNDITLDCQEHTLTLKDTSPSWVYMDNRSGVTIKNCIAVDAGELFISSSDNNYLVNNTVIGSHGQGIYLHVSSDYNTLIGNTLLSNTQSGIFAYSGGHNMLINNTANSNGQGGIRLLTEYDTITNNKACYNTGNSDNMKDINAYWGNATGDDNTCDTTYKFNDAGATGCTYSCPPPNQPPTANTGGPYSMNEGGTVTLDASSSSDPDDNIVLYEWDLDNDGAYDDATGTTTYVSFAENGVFTVGLKVTDDYGEFDTNVTEITVSNIAPTILSLSAPVDPMQVGAVVETSASFSDPGVLDTHTAIWDWGDGSSAGMVDGYNVSGSHVYDTPGVYTIILTVTDDDGGYATAIFQYVVVYDPEGGFVTGGGWIDSPEGAYTSDPSLTGKATFGFVSKYKKGASVPTGNTEFQFKVADLNFKSTSYDWLVVTGSDYARFKGVGTINNEGVYKFMIWAGDNDPDTFRIKIWYEEGDNEVEVYDNGMDQEIGGGSIVVHTAK